MHGSSLIAYAGLSAVLFIGTANLMCQAASTAVAVSPATMSKVGAVDERFQSYNIEAVEVTGGRFWKPYTSAGNSAGETEAKRAASSTPSGMDPSLYEYRPPLDLSNARLRKLAAALGPAYVRVSGTWMNAVYFQDSDDEAPAAPPKGFGSVLTRKQWKGVVDFANLTGASLVTSFVISTGTRDAEGVWTPDQAHKIVNYTNSLGGRIVAAEFMNEPTFAEMGSAPHGYDAHAYARDFAVFRQFVSRESPNMLIVGPGGVGEGSSLVPPSMAAIKSEDILAATGPSFSAFSYHLYAGVSHRCAQMGASATTTLDAALSDDWLSRSEKIATYYQAIRDRRLEGRPIWITETAQTACGGDRWASTFADSFRYLNQLGSMARMGVQVHMHNTLAASDYGLLDDKTYEPRPNYWAALLWRKMMGAVVLDPGPSPATSLHLYAQCLRDKPGGVAMLVINADRSSSQSLLVPTNADAYTLTAPQIDSKAVRLNGIELKLGAGDTLPKLKSKSTKAGQVSFAPESITFLAFPNVNNAACR